VISHFFKPPNELDLDRFQYMITRINREGRIEFVNDYCSDVTGFTSSELLGKPHSFLLHPEMPDLVCQMTRSRLNQNFPIKTITKNWTKEGKFFWLIATFEMKRNSFTKERDGYTVYYQPADKRVIKRISEIYKRLHELEAKEGSRQAKEFFKSFLREHNHTFTSFMEETIALRESSLLKKFFTLFKR
jgi:PAS domain S-box-containing protein